MSTSQATLRFVHKTNAASVGTPVIAWAGSWRRVAGESFRSIAKSVGFSVATVQNVLN
jgi:hypothetical protein